VTIWNYTRIQTPNKLRVNIKERLPLNLLLPVNREMELENSKKFLRAKMGEELRNNNLLYINEMFS